MAESAIDRTQGEELSGRWQRIPVEHFDVFLNAVAKLGVAESRKQTAQDVTEEFVDLEAQISNKKKLEERIVELVQNQSGEIKDVIEVERELGRVRGEIEQMEGRLRYLTNRAELTTVSIVARSRRLRAAPARRFQTVSSGRGALRCRLCRISASKRSWPPYTRFHGSLCWASFWFRVFGTSGSEILDVRWWHSGYFRAGLGKQKLHRFRDGFPVREFHDNRYRQ